QPVVRPEQGLPIDILLEQPLAHHQTEIDAGTPPGLVGALVDDVAEIVESAGMGRPPIGEPALARLPALPRPRREAQYLDLDPAALQRARHDIRADRGDRDRPASHRA